MDAHNRIAETLLRIQNGFLDTPGLTVTTREAAMLFGVDDITCVAILKALVEAHVLKRTRTGSYVREFPLQTAA